MAVRVSSFLEDEEARQRRSSKILLDANDQKSKRDDAALASFRFRDIFGFRFDLIGRGFQKIVHVVRTAVATTIGTSVIFRGLICCASLLRHTLGAIGHPMPIGTTFLAAATVHVDAFRILMALGRQVPALAADEAGREGQATIVVATLGAPGQRVLGRSALVAAAGRRRSRCCRRPGL